MDNQSFENAIPNQSVTAVAPGSWAYVVDFNDVRRCQNMVDVSDVATCQNTHARFFCVCDVTDGMTDKNPW